MLNLVFALIAASGPARNWQRGFPTPASPIAEGIFSFHDDLRVFLVGILCFVRYILWACLERFAFSEEAKKGISQRLIHASTIEIIWTIIPAVILVFIAFPSFSLLYSVDEIRDPLITVKVIGHQWYWSYEFVNPEAIANVYNEAIVTLLGGSSDIFFEPSPITNFDSYRVADEDLGRFQPRLLTVDNYLCLPVGVDIRARITSADVLHSWAVPSLGVKLDACPGRLNQTTVFIKRTGTYYGQCSEICGVNHGFRPIGVIGHDFLGQLGFAENAVLDSELILATLQAVALE